MMNMGLFSYMGISLLTASLLLSSKSVADSEMKKAKLQEAQAEVTFFEARKRARQSLLRRTQIHAAWRNVQLQRSRRLITKDALSASEYEEDLYLYQDAQELGNWVRHKIVEAEAEIVGAKARLAQIELEPNPQASVLQACRGDEMLGFNPKQFRFGTAFGQR